MEIQASLKTNTWYSSKSNLSVRYQTRVRYLYDFYIRYRDGRFILDSGKFFYYAGPDTKLFSISMVWSKYYGSQIYVPRNLFIEKGVNNAD